MEIYKFKTDLFNIKDIINALKFEEALVFPNNELFTPKTSFNLSNEKLKIDYPIGLVKKKLGITKTMKIKDEPYPESRIIFIPSNRIMDFIEKRFGKESDKSVKLTLEAEDKNDFIRLFLKMKKKGSHHYFELDYRDYFKIISSTAISTTFVLNPTGQSSLFTKIYEIDFMGIKLKINDKN